MKSIILATFAIAFVSTASCAKMSLSDKFKYCKPIPIADCAKDPICKVHERMYETIATIERIYWSKLWLDTKNSGEKEQKCGPNVEFNNALVFGIGRNT